MHQAQERQASLPLVNTLVDTTQFAVDQIVQNIVQDPDPPLVLATILLSLATGNLVGNSISEELGKKEKEKKEKDKEKEKEKEKEDHEKVCYKSSVNKYISTSIIGG